MTNSNPYSKNDVADQLNQSGTIEQQKDATRFYSSYPTNELFGSVLLVQ